MRPGSEHRTAARYRPGSAPAEWRWAPSDGASADRAGRAVLAVMSEAAQPSYVAREIMDLLMMLENYEDGRSEGTQCCGVAGISTGTGVVSETVQGSL